MSPKKELVYPFFLECLTYTDDSFWKNILEELAFGKAPKGTFISKGFLTCKYKGKEFSYKLERKEPEKLFDEILNILKNKLGILSNTEKIDKRNIFFHTEGTTKGKKNKDIAIQKFVIELKNKYNLSIKKTKILLSIITIGLLFKTITNKDIIFNGDSIESIEGISISDEGEIILEKDFIKGSIKKQEENITPNFMSDLWYEHIENIRNTYKIK